MFRFQGRIICLCILACLDFDEWSFNWIFWPRIGAILKARLEVWQKRSIQANNFICLSNFNNFRCLCSFRLSWYHLLPLQISSSSTITLVWTGNSAVCIISSSPRSWDIDLGASDYMIRDQGILSSRDFSSFHLSITLENGFLFSVEGIGAVNATFSLSLSSVL